MTSPISKVDAAKKRNEGGDWYKTNEVTANAPAFASPKSRVSNISCLTGEKGVLEGPTRFARAEESDFTKLSREGGHKGLLQIQENTRSVEPVKFQRKGGDWYYTEDSNKKSAVNKGGERNSYEEDLAKAHVRASETKESDYIKLARAGGNPDLLKISENKPVPKRSDFNAKSNPIWCGGDGTEMKTTPGGRRCAPKIHSEAPFASHY